MSRTMAHAAWLGLALFLAPSVRADETKTGAALAWLPGDTPLVLHVRGLERVLQRQEKMFQTAAPDIAKGWTEAALKRLFAGRRIGPPQGLIGDGSLLLAVPSLPDGVAELPPLALVARVSKYEQLRDSLLTAEERKELKRNAGGFESTTSDGEAIHFVDRKDHAIVTTDEKLAGGYTKQFVGLNQKLSRELIQRLTEPDVGIYVDMKAVNKKYGDVLRGFRALLNLALQQQAGMLDKYTIQVIKDVYNTLFQSIEDAEQVVLSVDFRPEGVSVRFHLGVGEKTTTAELFRPRERTPLADVASLPGDGILYETLAVDSALFKGSPLLFLSVPPELEGDDRKKADAAVEKLSSLGAGTHLAVNQLRGEGLMVWRRARDPVAAADAYLELFQAMKDIRSFSGTPLKGKPTIKANAQTHRGGKFHSVRMDWDFEKSFENVPDGEKQAKAMKDLLGSGATFWIGAVGKELFFIQTDTWKKAQTQLDRYLDRKQPLAESAGRAFTAVRNQLPPEAMVFALLHVPRGTALAAEYYAVFNGGKAPKAIKGEDCFAGAAVVFQRRTMDVDLWMPALGVPTVRKTIEYFLLQDQ